MKKNDKLVTGFLVFLLIAGMAIMAYPKVSDWWNTRVQMRAIRSYEEQVAQMDDKRIEELLGQAYDYNQRLAKLDNPFKDYEELKDYYEVLDITDTGIMGYVTIPAIDVKLPVYHGTNSEVLNIAIGHLQGSSLPVGGPSTHSVLSAHRGLPSAKLFSDLDELKEGDLFMVTVMNYTVTYEVDQIKIVLPDDIKELQIKKGEDLATLLTCTPYGINTHRLLVRGHRVENVKGVSTAKVTADAVVIDKGTVVPFIAVPLFICLVAIWMLQARNDKEKRKRRKRIYGKKL